MRAAMLVLVSLLVLSCGGGRHPQPEPDPTPSPIPERQDAGAGASSDAAGSTNSACPERYPEGVASFCIDGMVVQQGDDTECWIARRCDCKLHVVLPCEAENGEWICSSPGQQSKYEWKCVNGTGDPAHLGEFNARCEPQGDPVTMPCASGCEQGQMRAADGTPTTCAQ